MGNFSIFVTTAMAANGQTQFNLEKGQRKAIIGLAANYLGLDKVPHLGKGERNPNLQISFKAVTPKGTELSLNLKDVCLHVSHQEGETKKALGAIWTFLSKQPEKRYPLTIDPDTLTAVIVGEGAEAGPAEIEGEPPF